MSRSAFTVLDPRGNDCFLTNVSDLERIAGGMRWAEGPVWFGDARCLIWSDVPSNRMYRWTEDGHVGVFREPSGYANGNTRDREGRLVTCEHEGRRVTRTEMDGAIVVLADRYDGRRLNSPNDVVVRRDGTIWFSDPDYGIMTDYEGGRREAEVDVCAVYCLDVKKGVLVRVSDEYMRPNGLAFSPDETLLYVADSGGSHTAGGPKQIFVHDVADGPRLGPRRPFAGVSVGVPDGFRVDERGNVWTSTGVGVEVYAPDGTAIGRIDVPEPVSNVTFGGRYCNRLFITAASSVYAAFTAVRGS